jgi:hypothetical protein
MSTVFLFASGGYGICVSQTGLKLVLHPLDVRRNLLEVCKSPREHRAAGEWKHTSGATDSVMAKSLEAEALYRGIEFGLFVTPKAKVAGSLNRSRLTCEVDANGEKAKSKTASQA